MIIVIPGRGTAANPESIFQSLCSWIPGFARRAAPE